MNSSVLFTHIPSLSCSHYRVLTKLSSPNGWLARFLVLNLYDPSRFVRPREDRPVEEIDNYQQEVSSVLHVTADHLDAH